MTTFSPLFGEEVNRWKFGDRTWIFLIYFVTKHACLTGVWVPQQKKCRINICKSFFWSTDHSLQPKAWWTSNQELELLLMFSGVFLGCFLGPSILSYFLSSFGKIFTTLHFTQGLLSLPFYFWLPFLHFPKLSTLSHCIIYSFFPIVHENTFFLCFMLNH